MRYLVTGGCGFIGGHLCRALAARGDDVTVLDNLSTGRREATASAARLVEGDAADPEALGAAIDGVDGVFHLAAVASVQRCNESWRHGHMANQLATVSVLEAARDAGCVPVVYASSAAVYGNAEPGRQVETRPPAPTTAYGVDKLGSEMHARIAQDIHGVRTVGLRPFNVYGPGQSADSPYSGAISIFAAQMLKGTPFTVFGDGLQSRDFVYVADVVRFFLAAMSLENSEPAIFNVATGQDCTLVDLIAVLSEVMSLPASYRHGPERSGDIRTSCGSPSLAARVLGVTASTPLIEGLRKTFCPAPSTSAVQREREAPPA